MRSGAKEWILSEGVEVVLLSQPLDHQKFGAARVLYVQISGHRCTILADETSLGKIVQELALVDATRNEAPEFALVICPAW